jgi:hypothetical protein
MNSPLSPRDPWRITTDELLKLYERATPTPPPTPSRDAPRLVGDGPTEFSTSGVVDITPRFVWDTNGFYRALGVSTDAPRRAVARSAVGALNGLLHDPDAFRWADRAVRILLNPSLRKKYDATPLGMFWADDERLLRRERQLPGDEEELVAVEGWPWSYYVFGLDESDLDEVSMAEWRALVCMACIDRDVSAQIGLGLASGGGIELLQIGYRVVVMVGLDIKPSWYYAVSVASALAERPH